jgi:D-alanyl-D-alanine carboxypeptidase (penicillin-binding protein 5/6)
LIFDNDTSQIYYQKNINKKRSIASTTKILTCLVALENTQLDDTVTLSSEAVTTHLTKLRGVGDKVKMKDLLYAAMVASDNGSATAIAQYTGGSIKDFAKMMNERAKQIGCTSSHFTNPQGFTSDNHYSTALDLALITQEAYKNKELRKIIKAKSYSFTTLKKKNTYEYNTTNKLLGEISGVTGMKTGTTSAAGKCNVCTYTHNNKTYIIVVLGSNQEGRWNDTKKLINYVNQYC